MLVLWLGTWASDPTIMYLGLKITASLHDGHSGPDNSPAVACCSTADVEVIVTIYVIHPPQGDGQGRKKNKEQHTFGANKRIVQLNIEAVEQFAVDIQVAEEVEVWRENSTCP